MQSPLQSRQNGNSAAKGKSMILHSVHCMAARSCNRVASLPKAESLLPCMVTTHHPGPVEVAHIDMVACPASGSDRPAALGGRCRAPAAAPEHIQEKVKQPSACQEAECTQVVPCQARLGVSGSASHRQGQHRTTTSASTTSWRQRQGRHTTSSQKPAMHRAPAHHKKNAITSMYACVSMHDWAVYLKLPQQRTHATGRLQGQTDPASLPQSC